MNEVKIEAGKVGRLSAGYHFTEKENEVLDRIKILDFGASNVFEFWIARIIRKSDFVPQLFGEQNKKENEKDHEQLVNAILRIKNLDSDLHDDLIKIINE